MAIVEIIANNLYRVRFVLNTTINIAIMDCAVCRLGKQLSRNGSTTLTPSSIMGFKLYNKGSTFGSVCPVTVTGKKI
jgi:hypothetical protein